MTTTAREIKTVLVWTPLTFRWGERHSNLAYHGALIKIRLQSTANSFSISSPVSEPNGAYSVVITTLWRDHQLERFYL